MTQKSVVVTMRLSRRDLEKIEAVRSIEKVERSTLLKEFIGMGCLGGLLASTRMAS